MNTDFNSNHTRYLQMIKLDSLEIEIINGCILYTYQNKLYSDNVSNLIDFEIGVDSIEVNIGNGCNPLSLFNVIV